MPETALSQEREAILTAERMHLEAAEGVDAAAMGAEEAHYMPPQIEPQWMIAYKLNVDDEGEYGIPHPVPIGELTNGSRLLALRRIDGGRAWTTVRPARVAPEGTIECIAERCGDAHIGGKRKRLHTMEALIKHVEAFHYEDFKTYEKYLDQIADALALQNPRLQALMDEAGISGTTALRDPADAVFYCDDDNCTRFFDSQAGLDAHMRSHRT